VPSGQFTQQVGWALGRPGVFSHELLFGRTTVE